MYVPLHCLVYNVGESYQRIAVSSSECSKSLLVNVQKNCIVFTTRNSMGKMNSSAMKLVEITFRALLIICKTPMTIH